MRRGDSVQSIIKRDAPVFVTFGKLRLKNAVATIKGAASVLVGSV